MIEDEAEGDGGGYSILQRPCPECGHEQHDVVMEHRDLVQNDYVEAICSGCGATYAKPIQNPSSRDRLRQFTQ